MLFSRWQETASRYRDQVAVIDGGRSWSFSDLVAGLKDRTPADGPVLARGSVVEIAVSTLQGWRDGQPVLPLEKGAAIPDLPASFPEGTAHLKLTPGIEGTPRAVFFSASQIAADADRLVSAMGLRPGMPNLAAISVTHSYGFSGIILPLLLHGIPVHVVEVPFPKVMVDAMSAHEAVALQAVPSMWKAWHRAGILRDARIALAVSAGAPLSLELEHKVFSDCGLKLHNFYGASECGGISYDGGDSPRECASDLGAPLPGVAVRLCESGRFLVESDSVALGYESAREGEILGGGQYLTQDFGRIETGRLMLENSGAESINVAGRKIGPAKIESALMASGLVERARVFGVKSHDPERVEEITALVALKSGTLEQLRQRMTEVLAGWEMPRHWETAADVSAWSLSRAELKKRWS
ncbi:AMP-binding protein [Luteolibacter flavescens]|uniref:AMP-binding protein n=1 Tax=Luteolibacter flavescens TaxID=1859460 RepID=A0ABT3FUB7_9BACT|nr:AMP-binding protein [Luteolibacter flavescens]MCW1886889.1 AMP-binding protein [Luteolibacter flavescens]